MKKIIKIFTVFILILLALDALFIIICGVLKLYAFIDWSWLYILTPLILTGALIIALLTIMLVGFAIYCVLY